MRKRNLRNRNNESGIALLIVLMALFLVAAVGMGMIYMSNTETTINTNYRDTQLAFFSMRGGLEEMRDRMRASAPSPITLPTAMPSTTAGSHCLYHQPRSLGDRGSNVVRQQLLRRRVLP